VFIGWLFSSALSAMDRWQSRQIVSGITDFIRFCVFWRFPIFQSNFLCVVSMACSVLERLALQFSLSPDPVAFLLLAVDLNLLRLVYAHQGFTELPCLSSSDICSKVLNLEYGYKVFSARFTSNAYDPGVNLTVLVTKAVQSYWSATWSRQYHITWGVTGGLPFPGHYSAVFAYWVTLPCGLKLFDYFDFFSKLDLDAPYRRDTC
jgi:hypothetical protein